MAVAFKLIDPSTSKGAGGRTARADEKYQRAQNIAGALGNLGTNTARIMDFFKSKEQPREVTEPGTPDSASAEADKVVPGRGT